jgi:hypothetical protein
MWYGIYCVIIAAKYTTYLLFCNMVASTLVGNRWICTVNTYCSLSHIMVSHKALHGIDSCFL